MKNAHAGKNAEKPMYSFGNFSAFFLWSPLGNYEKKYHFHFIPIGAETLGPFGPHAVQFLEDLGNKISQINGERRSKSFLFQSIGIAIQRGNASCVMGTTGSMGKLEELNYL